MLALVSGVIFAKPLPWSDRAPLIEKKLQEAVAHYVRKDIASAKHDCDDAYFGFFEAHGANMEIAIRSNVSAARAAEIESHFGELRKAISNSTTIPKASDEIKSRYASLVDEVKKAAKELDAQGVSLQ